MQDAPSSMRRRVRLAVLISHAEELFLKLSGERYTGSLNWLNPMEIRTF